jgi:hypothetical protein
VGSDDDRWHAERREEGDADDDRRARRGDRVRAVPAPDTRERPPGGDDRAHTGPAEDLPAGDGEVPDDGGAPAAPAAEARTEAVAQAPRDVSGGDAPESGGGKD